MNLSYDPNPGFPDLATAHKHNSARSRFGEFQTKCGESPVNITKHQNQRLGINPSRDNVKRMT